MGRSRIREDQVVDGDFLSEYEHEHETPHYFSKLVDVPTISGAAGKSLVVNHDESGLLWTTISGGDSSVPPGITINQFFGAWYEYDASEGYSATNSTVYRNKVSFITSILDEGVYRINWYYEWQRDDTSSAFRARVTINDSLTIMETELVPKDKNKWGTQSGFYSGTFSNESLSIDLDYCGTYKAKTSGIRRARIEIWRVD